MSWATCPLVRFISHFWSKIITRVGKHFFWAREQIHVILLTGRDLCFYNQTNQIKFKIVLIVKFSSWFLYTWIEQWVWIILMWTLVYLLNYWFKVWWTWKKTLNNSKTFYSVLQILTSASVRFPIVFDHFHLDSFTSTPTSP